MSRISGEAPLKRSGPVARKVKASTAGSAAGSVIGAFVLWLLDEYVIGAGVEGDVPGVVAAFVLLVVSSALTFAAGYQTHKAARD